MFVPKLNDTYYSVGPLQNISGIEQWVYTEDVYDTLRAEIGNIFETFEDAKYFKELLIKMTGENNGK